VARWLEDFETFYRSIGLLGAGFKVSQDDRCFANDVARSSLERLVRTRWLHESAHRDLEFELLGEIHGSNALQWWHDEMGHGAWTRALMGISRGAFMPVDFVQDWHADDAFFELRCTWAGHVRRLFHPRTKYLSGAVLHEINRWIAHTGRRFARIGGNINGEPVFACLDDRELAALRERGVEPWIPAGWDTDPRELVPLLEHLMNTRDCALLLAAASFNETLMDREPALHFFAGAALVGLGRNDEGNRHLGIAVGRGVEGAFDRVTAWLA